MDKLELKPYEAIDGVKYKVVHLTDIKLHSAPKKPTSSFGKKVRESFQSKSPGRVYNHLPKPLEIQNDNSFIFQVLQFDQDFMNMVREEEAKGYKILISVPKEGVPILFGEDTIEFLDSKNGKRLLRGLDKNKSWDKM